MAMCELISLLAPPSERPGLISAAAGIVCQVSPPSPLAAAPVLALVFFSSLPLSFFELQLCSGRAALPPPGEQPRRACPERRLTWHRGAAAAQVCTPERREELLGRVRHHLTALKRMTCGKHICARVEKLLETTHKAQLNAAVRRPTLTLTLRSISILIGAALFLALHTAPPFWPPPPSGAQGTSVHQCAWRGWLLGSERARAHTTGPGLAERVWQHSPRH